MGRRRIAAVLLLASLCGGVVLMLNRTDRSVNTERPAARIRNVTITQVAPLTGPESVNKTDAVYDVAGTDLGSMFDLNGRLYFVFGDTFGKQSTLPPGQGPTTNWRSNVVAYASDLDPTDGIRLDGFLTNAAGEARELIPSKKVQGDNITSIPTYGVAVNGKMYLYYMAVDKWGEPGVWETAHSGVYTSADEGRTWKRLPKLTWEGDSNFAQVAIVKPEQNTAQLGNDVYFYGVKAGRFGGVKLMKVDAQQIEDKESYLYFAGLDRQGRPTWSAAESEAADILETTAGELSVVWNPGLRRWIMTYINGSTTNIDLAEAEHPWGPWTEPRPIVLQAKFPGLYGSYMHPAFLRDDGRTIYFVMSRWNSYNAYMMKAELQVNE